MGGAYTRNGNKSSQRIIKGYYFEKINNNILDNRLVKNVIAYVPFLSVKYILLVIH